MVHYCNDYFDFAADQTNLTPTRWSGGSRVLPDGHLSPYVARTAALTLGGIALASTLLLVLVAKPGPLALPMLLLAILLSWSYSAPPLRLHSRGLGELTSVLVVSSLTPLLGYYLQAQQLSVLPMLAI